MAERSQIEELCSASACGNLSEVLSLLQNGANVNGFNKYKRTALQVVKLGAPRVVEAVLKAGGNPHVRDHVCGLMVIHDAAREGFVETVRVLIEYGADVNVVDERGNLPLHLAAKEGNLEVVQLLLGCTADPTKPNKLGHTAAQLAHTFRRTETAKCIDDHLSARE
ncbi:cyclin-dependent kinase 4 inhibitor C [Thalassophryne amazonica]|uniref:cyclin-dependent kinase 4 inhibitor C n=1 Tax=Thalassophryne amazonica TaxID=390379 RepID=UPI001471C052|nr:cyclin-dependent kinase 4 inhibitor C [Thalassophryne amazonica]